jgi:hypothetical protein
VGEGERVAGEFGDGSELRGRPFADGAGGEAGREDESAAPRRRPDLPLGVTGSPGSSSVVYNGSTDTSTGHNDLRATYPGHDIDQERRGDYVYAAATAAYGLVVWTDAQNATVCGPVLGYRAASLAAGRTRCRHPGCLPTVPARSATPTSGLPRPADVPLSGVVRSRDVTSPAAGWRPEGRLTGARWSRKAPVRPSCSLGLWLWSVPRGSSSLARRFRS